MRTSRPRHSAGSVASLLVTFVLTGVLGFTACATSATRTEGAGPVDNVELQTRTRCTYVKEYQLFLYTADLQINTPNKSAEENRKVADGLRAAGAKVQGAIPEFGPYVGAITTDRVARLTAATPPPTTVSLDDARQIVGTYQSANCPDTSAGTAPAGVAPAAGGGS